MNDRIQGYEIADAIPRDHGRRIATALGLPYDDIESVTLDHRGATAVVYRRDGNGKRIVGWREPPTITVVVPWEPLDEYVPVRVDPSKG